MVLAAGGGDALLLVELGAVLLACGLLARVATHLALSPIPFYLVIGLLINESGPLGLGGSLEFIEIGAAIGVVLLVIFLESEERSDKLWLPKSSQSKEVSRVRGPPIDRSVGRTRRAWPGLAWPGLSTAGAREYHVSPLHVPPFR